MQSEADRPELYRKLGEAYQIPPWTVPMTLTIPQFWALWCSEGAPASHDEALDRVNRRRARKGMMELSDKPPGRQEIVTISAEGRVVEYS